MSGPARLALIDDRSTASNPGGLSVQPLRYAAHFPLWPVFWAGALLLSVAWAVCRPHWWWLPLVPLVFNGLFWLRVRLRFRLGCVNPSLVVATQPFTLAVFTDLNTGAAEAYPVIKIMRHPQPRGTSCQVGEKCATVATYIGSGQAGHWQDFFPILADCATTDRRQVEAVLCSIPAEEWSALEEGLQRLPLPLKQGLYPLDCCPRAQAQEVNSRS